MSHTRSRSASPAASTAVATSRKETLAVLAAAGSGRCVSARSAWSKAQRGARRRRKGRGSAPSPSASPPAASGREGPRSARPS
eukprot:CAMPEP_0119168884 /NCGR_PEP_ID=MMETSP1315-20130426/7494_1 /TAXON_ID=676789 /ORGANISM="Prasinoderma singularis, Strain RCC927" /LENGTH=82 /DNA_ID=CAMNT_0007162427 /DNA_START=349 /DNA_END=595 /DNA_ORIENTATION=-